MKISPSVLFSGSALLLLGGGLGLYLAQKSEPVRSAVPRAQTHAQKSIPSHVQPTLAIPPAEVLSSTPINLVDPDPDGLSPFVRDLLDCSDADYTKGLACLSDLHRKPWGQQDEAALLHWLLQDPPSSTAQLGLHSLKNEVIAEMIERNLHLDRLGMTVVKLLTDEQAHPVIREYAAQFVPQIHQKLFPSAMPEDKASVALRSALVNAMMEATHDTSDALGGTAMMKLAELAPREALIPQDELLQKARDCAFYESGSTASRLGAFQTLGLLPSPENAQSCIDFANLVSASPALRAAAIYAASCNGINDDLIALSRDINSKKDVDPRLLGAANAVLMKSQNATP